MRSISEQGISEMNFEVRPTAEVVANDDLQYIEACVMCLLGNAANFFFRFHLTDP